MKNLFKEANANLADTGKVHPFDKVQKGKFYSKIVLLFTLLVLSQKTGFSNEKFHEIKVYFKFDSSTISTFEKQKLNTVIDQELLACDSIILLGYADSTGNNKYNKKLSEKRLFVVSEYLKNKDEMRAVYSENYYGEESPIFIEPNKYIPQENRCVRILFHKQKTELSALIEEKENPLDEIDTVILTKSGVEITIDTCTYKGVNYQDITFEFKEALDIDDMKTYNLETVDSENRCLSSGGMYYIKATHNNVELAINPDCPIKMKVPVKKKNPQMSLYKMNEKTGKWYKSSPEPIAIDNANYSYELGYDGWHNLDFPMGNMLSKGLEIINPYKGIAIQSKNTEGLNVYLVSKPDNFMMKLKIRDRDKLIYVSPKQCLDPDRAEIYISKEGVSHELHFGLKEMKHRKLKNKFVINRSQLAIFTEK